MKKILIIRSFGAATDLATKYATDRYNEPEIDFLVTQTADELPSVKKGGAVFELPSDSFEPHLFDETLYEEIKNKDYDSVIILAATLYEFPLKNLLKIAKKINPDRIIGVDLTGPFVPVDTLKFKLSRFIYPLLAGSVFFVLQFPRLLLRHTFFSLIPPTDNPTKGKNND